MSEEHEVFEDGVDSEHDIGDEEECRNVMCIDKIYQSWSNVTSKKYPVFYS